MTAGGDAPWSGSSVAATGAWREPLAGFKDLLQQLERVHERELAILRADLFAARAQLGLGDEDPSPGCTCKELQRGSPVLESASAEQTEGCQPAASAVGSLVIAAPSHAEIEVIEKPAEITQVGMAKRSDSSASMDSVDDNGPSWKRKTLPASASRKEKSMVTPKIYSSYFGCLDEMLDSNIKSNTSDAGKSFTLKAMWTEAPGAQAMLALDAEECRLPLGTGSAAAQASHPLKRQRASIGSALQEERRTGVRALVRFVTCALWPPSTLSPNSSLRVGWDLAGLLLISYDLITIPLQAFEPPESFITDVMDWVARLFWTGDMIQAFLVGYYDHGILVMKFSRIVLHYMRTWFIVDLAVVGSDWFTLLQHSSDQGTSTSGLGRIFRGSRAIRVLRLLRLLKLQRMFNMLYDMIENESTFLFVNLAKLLVFVLVLNHAIACMWYFVGQTSKKNGERNWIDVGQVEGNLAYEYTTAMHWSLTQFTPASMDISARNSAERIFSIVVLFFAMVAFSSVVGSITSSMTSLRNMKGDNMKQFWLLRRYLRQQQAPKGLAQRIIKYLEHQTSQPVVVQPKQVHILDKLSEQLQSELKFNTHAPWLRGHPLFEYLCTELVYFMHMIASKSMASKPLAPEDVVFNPGDEAASMYFVKEGSVIYSVTVPIKPPLGVREWVSEPALWTHWRHRGQMQALTPAELIVLSPKSFGEVMRLHPLSFSLCRRYAEIFIDLFNSIDLARLTDVLRSNEFYIHAVQTASEATPDEFASENFASEGIHKSEHVVQTVEVEKAEQHENDVSYLSSKSMLYYSGPTGVTTPRAFADDGTPRSKNSHARQEQAWQSNGVLDSPGTASPEAVELVFLEAECDGPSSLVGSKVHV